MRVVLAFALLLATAGSAQAARVARGVEKIMASADGLSPSTAFEVNSVEEEYQIAAAMKVKVLSQSLVIENKPYDVLEVSDKAGKTRKIWFDISKFYNNFQDLILKAGQ